MAKPNLRADGGPELLLVDDDSVLCDLLSRAFVARGFEVRSTNTVATALKLAGMHTPEYAVIGLKFPDRPGLSLLSSLIGLDPNMRIVILTGYGNIATAIDAIKLGATYYLCKPANADDIIAAFSHVIGDDSTPPRDKPMSTKRLEWEHIWHVLRNNQGNVSQAARELSMHRRTLQRKLAKHPVKA